MVGQGSPNKALTPDWLREFVRLAVRFCALASAFVLLSGTLAAETIDLRLRIAWGGGTNRQWRGEIRLSEGRLSAVSPLGMEADEPGSMQIEAGVVRIQQRSPRIYDGLDLQIDADRAAQLTLELTPVDNPQQVQRTTLTLEQLIENTHSEAVDDQGNRLLIRRTPGDRLRLSFHRDSLVFDPGETFGLSAVPHLIQAPAGASLQCVMRLTADKDGTEAWSEVFNVQSNDLGQAPAIGPAAIAIPETEGVYTLDVEIGPQPSRLPTFLRKPAPLAQRKLQLVVISPKPRSVDPTAFTPQFEINPAQTGWWDRFLKISPWTLLPGFGQGPLGNGATSTATFGELKLTALEPQGWQAYPLPVSRTGKPHILVVEAPADRVQNLGISIVEPNAVGVVGPIGLDSGVFTPPSPLNGSDMVTHRIVFWPRTSQPLVLLTNRGEGAAWFGKLRLLSGGDSLPLSPAAEASNQRLLSAYYEKPLFPEAMSVTESIDPWTNRPLDDWNGFYEGAIRLVQHLKYAGYNSAVIPVVCEGSSLYPSRLLQPTPKYDSGVFYVTAQDPIRKDVLEMLLRIFDREGLLLVPSVQFASPLPELEILRRREAMGGMELIGVEGRPYLAVHGAKEGLAPYYNPLDPRVQKAMVEVIDELAERCAKHPSFAGLSLSIGPNSYAQLPGKEWGYDDETVARFENTLGVVVPGEGEKRFLTRANHLLGPKREIWLRWRAGQIAALHERFARSLTARQPTARLLLTGGELLSSRAIVDELHPQLPETSTIADAMLNVGIAAELYSEKELATLVRPQNLSAESSLLASAVDLQLRNDADVDRYFASSGHSATIFFHQRQPLQLPSFDAVSPFGADRTHTWLLTHAAPAGKFNRQRFVHALAAADCRTMLDGGWMPLQGQEAATAEIFHLYRKLPDRPFETVVSKTHRSQSVVVRYLHDGGQTYLYLVNDSPWPATVEIHLNAPIGCELLPLTPRQLPPLEGSGESLVWRVSLDPYDLAGTRLDLPNVKILDYTFRSADNEPIAAELMRQVDGLKSRISGLANSEPMKNLVNPGFEDAPVDEAPPGWVFPTTPGVTFQTDSQEHHQGKHSLRISSNGPVAWMRSSPLPAPTTGRLSAWVWLRISDPNVQPPLRLAIEGRLNGKVYYRFASVGAGERSPALSNDWQPYVFHIDDLPSENLSDLRIGFDLMGPGEVWIDDIQLFDLWFYENERDELAKNIAVADFHLSRGNIADCQRILEGYWPQFLTKFVPLRPAMTASRPVKETEKTPVGRPPGSTPPEETPQDPPAEAPTFFNRMKSYLPSRLRPF
ncbi:alpha-amylase family protein [Lignipirellula cremea]|uniref:Glycosyl hydrolase-like 10 domain-containing protein n=1 Tax=Lignipirellula cremea TaxID=2528010 RepID=A0A518DU33_9BACT|nr:hypothetical protein [Lignipirellula cremea]QDU95350.1 hypothetical protein Pla8534_31650 [Lignipirellula cremea]